jgi:diguanylate cyclase (GGDEF)-like protein
VAQLPRKEMHFRRLAFGWFVAAAVSFAFALAQGGRPPLAAIALFGGLGLLAENIGLLLPTSVGVSPHLVVTLAAVGAFRSHGIVAGAIVVGACGGISLAPLRGRRYGVILFNVAQLALSAGAAGFCYSVMVADRMPLYVAFPVTAVAYVAVNSGLCAPAAAVKAGVSIQDVWADMRQAAVSGVVFGVLGLLLGLLYRDTGAMALVVAVGVAVVAQIVFLAVVRLRQAYTRLELLYRFTQRLERHREEPEAVMSILGEVRQVMRAGSAELTVLTEFGWRRTSLADGRRPVVDDGEGAPPEAAVVADGPVRLADLTPDDPLRQGLVGRLGPGGMLAPMRSDGQLLGLLGLGRAADGRSFGPEDTRLLEALTNHAAVSLDNSRLLGRLRYDSSHDLLTGLPNRTRFNELLGDLPRPSAILLIDLDRFKEINDTLGHHHGDLLLRRVAERIAEEVGHHGIVARLGGDEFGVLLPQTGPSNAAQMAVSLLAALEQPFGIGELELEITGSIGVAVASPGDADAARLLQQADVAMYSAKEAHSGWELYSLERDHYSPRRLALAGELRRAIETGELIVHYQPKSELRTGRVCGVEALVRWRHPRYGVIGPDQFIPVAESAGLIRPLTLLVLTAAIQQQRELRALGYDLEVAVNLSVRSVLDVNLPDQIAQVLEAHGVEPASLTLEITESSVMADPARTIGILGRLAALGTNISVDDFGTGYSSLSYLKRLPANEVKIDRSFVAGMLTSDSDRAIVRSTVDLARNLGLRAVAEGVEDAATWAALCDIGCDYAQGYFLSPPIPADDLRQWLLTSKPAPGPLS